MSNSQMYEIENIWCTMLACRESGGLPSEWPATTTHLCARLFQQLVTGLLLTECTNGPPNGWWMHPCTRPTGEGRGGGGAGKHWLSWPSILEMGATKCSPRGFLSIN